MGDVLCAEFTPPPSSGALSITESRAHCGTAVDEWRGNHLDCLTMPGATELAGCIKGLKREPKTS